MQAPGDGEIKNNFDNSCCCGVAEEIDPCNGVEHAGLNLRKKRVTAEFVQDSRREVAGEPLGKAEMTPA